MSIAKRPPAVDTGIARGRALVLLTAVLWSLAGVFIKSLSLNPLVITFYRSLFASLFFAFFAPRLGWHMTAPLLVSVASYTASINLFVWANKLTTAANAIVLQYTAPIFVFLFVRLLFREAISRSNLRTLILGMAGVAIIFAGSRGAQDLQGVGLATLSGLFFSIYLINLRFLRAVDPAALTFANNLVCFLTLLPLVAPRPVPSAVQLLALAVMGVVQLGIPYFLFSKGLETLPLQEASLIVLIEPVLNPIWVALAVHEVPSPATLIGGGLIVFSLTLRYLYFTEH